jgi:hypothetical protein
LLPISGYFMFLDFVFVEKRGKAVHYYPRERSAEINNFVHSEGHNAGGQNIITHVGIPSCPELLKVIQRNMSSTYLVELGPVLRKSLRKSRIPAISVSDRTRNRGHWTYMFASEACMASKITKKNANTEERDSGGGKSEGEI